ncbi:MAG: disulfide bond formation protein B [Actinomycetota bacterium]
MSTELVTTFMATLLILGFVGVAGALVHPGVRALVAPERLQFAAAVAVLAVLSSLYLSEIADYDPCRYCWWQRIFMYPLAIVLPIAAWHRDLDVRRYALPLASIGGAISLRHIWLQTFPDDGGSCGVSAPCSAKLVEAFGFITIPQMTAGCFLLILILLANRTPLAQES